MTTTTDRHHLRPRRARRPARACSTHRAFFLRHRAGASPTSRRAHAPTVSALSLGGLVKHVAAVEAGWPDFVEHGGPRGAVADSRRDDAGYAGYGDGFRLLPEETLDGVLAALRSRSPRAPTSWSRDRRPRREPPAARGAVVRARRELVGTAGCCCTSSPRRPSTPATPTSSGRPSTASGRWADRVGGRQSRPRVLSRWERNASASTAVATRQFGAGASTPSAGRRP